MTLPQPSDLLLLPTTEKVYGFVVGLDEDSLQSICPLYAEALARALRTAAQAHVDVWETMDGFSFTLIAQHREQRAESAPTSAYEEGTARATQTTV